MTQSSIQIFISSHCPNSQRLLAHMNRIPTLRHSTIYDVDTMSPAELRGLTAVPTIIDSTKKMYVGSKAFEFLSHYSEEVELECEDFGSGSGGLIFAQVDGDGCMQYVHNWGAFEKPT
jgi:hypothetical protein